MKGVKNIALVLAGGSGSRLGGDCPKQYIELQGKPIIFFCLDTLTTHAAVDAIWIVAEEKWRLYIQGIIQTDKIIGFSKSGASRQLSIWNAMQDMKQITDENSLLLIHDAARPLLKTEQITECFCKIGNHDGIMPVLPMKDTVYFSRDGKAVDSLLNRNVIFAGQAPELFRFEKYYRANAGLSYEQMIEVKGSTEPAILAGMDIAMIPGDENNFKVTTNVDLERFCKMMQNA